MGALVSLVGSAGPVLFGGLVGLAMLLVWIAFAPSRAAAPVDGERLDTYLQSVDPVQEEMLRRSFFQRAIVPIIRSFLRLLGRLAPGRNVEQSRQLLIQAGDPMGLSVLDYYGLRIMVAGGLAGGYFLLAGMTGNLLQGLPATLLLGVMGYLLPFVWVRMKRDHRQHEIERALPDALDMLTIGVEAGLGFDSAMMRVGEEWDNALTAEFRRVVAEMRVGTDREVALQRMAERAGAQDLRSFVAVLVQSSRLGVSIADVLHIQAEQMRLKRSQRAEEQAQKAGIKMLFPLIFLIFPTMFVVILGPVIPSLLGFLGM